MAQNIPRPEHPRPDSQREKWINLNGDWDFSFDENNEGIKNSWFKPNKIKFEKSITVPFCIESRASGIGKIDFKGAAWYKRIFTVPAEWKNDQVWLHFGAVDWQCSIWVNGKKAGDHAGGYSSFSFNVTSYLKPGANTVAVRIFDETNREQQQKSWPLCSRYSSSRVDTVSEKTHSHTGTFPEHR